MIWLDTLYTECGVLSFPKAIHFTIMCLKFFPLLASGIFLICTFYSGTWCYVWCVFLCNFRRPVPVCTVWTEFRCEDLWDTGLVLTMAGLNPLNLKGHLIDSWNYELLPFTNRLLGQSDSFFLASIGWYGHRFITSVLILFVWFFVLFTVFNNKNMHFYCMYVVCSHLNVLWSQSN